MTFDLTCPKTGTQTGSIPYFESSSDDFTGGESISGGSGRLSRLESGTDAFNFDSSPTGGDSISGN